ncbi:MAG: YqeG family HAD IIIA-type phosphatase [Bacillota bacterium]|nr:YqeG family HAD IIIA-type phosphatase [Bacillota bacterium]
MRGITKWRRYLVPADCAEKVEEIDLHALWTRGLRGLILDLDNTLTRWNQVEVPPPVAQWVEAARRLGFALCLVSNGLPARVGMTARCLGIPALARAVKPSRRAFLRALELLGTEAGSTCVVGDQLFTDILGGNRAGMYTILVRPRDRRELPTTRLVRFLEGIVLRRWERKGLLCWGRPAGKG